MRLLIPATAALGLTAAAAFSFARGEDHLVTGDVTIIEAWARATPPGATVGASYLTIENRGAAADTLLSAESPVAEEVSIHQTVEANGVAEMRPLQDGAEIPAGGTLAMAPGGVHLMLVSLKAPLREGESIGLTLHFEHAGSMDVELDVAPIGAPAPGMDHGAMPMDDHSGHGGHGSM